MRALIITDVQNDFLPLGSLAVKGGDRILDVINQLIPYFDHVIATQDWHPHNHISFGNPWPIHCVENTWGSEFSPFLDQNKIEVIFHKGVETDTDSYSVFFDARKRPSTQLHEYLQKKKITELYFVGLATDYCVLYSALDAAELGYKVHVIRDGCRAIGDEESAFRKMRAKGIDVLTSSQLSFVKN